MRFPVVRPAPTRFMYQAAVVIVLLFIAAFLWFVVYTVIVPLEAGVSATMAQYDIVNSTYPAYELAATFMLNLWLYMLVIVVLGLAYWVYIYSQRKGQGMYPQ